MLWREACLSRISSLAIIAALLSVGCSGQVAATRFAIRDVTVIDGTGAAPRQHSRVVVTDEKISSTGNESGPVPTGYTAIDGRGKFLIPGLWDMHVHIAAFTANPKWSRPLLLPLYVANGVTGVRDMGGDPEVLKKLKAEAAAGELLGPQIVTCGRLLNGRPDRQFPYVIGVRTVEEARAAVDAQKADGADCIKELSSVPPEAFFALAAESRKVGLPFVGHVPEGVSIFAASDAGEASMEHLFGLLMATSKREDELREKRLKAFAARDSKAAVEAEDEAIASYDGGKAQTLYKKFIANHNYQTPTFSYLMNAYNGVDLDPNDPHLKYVPASIRGDFTPAKVHQGESAAELAHDRGVYDRLVQLVSDMHKAGVPMLAGTDSFDPYDFPGSSLHNELAWFVRAGFTPSEALQVATREAAKFLGKEKESGTIELGKRADLVLLSADPTKDIHALDQIFAVILNGRYLDRAKLDSILAEAQRFAANN